MMASWAFFSSSESEFQMPSDSLVIVNCGLPEIKASVALLSSGLMDSKVAVCCKKYGTKFGDLFDKGYE